LNTDTAKVLSKPKTETKSGINKDDVKYKEGTYYYYLKQLGQTPDQARASVKQFKPIVTTPIAPTPMKTEVSEFTPENNYDKGEEFQKELTVAGQDMVADRAKIGKESALANKMQNLGILGEQEARIMAERDTAINEINDSMITQYEGNRLNQVRGSIAQALAQRGVDIANLSPEAMIQLSGEVGSRAFTDIYQQKESAKAKVQSLRASAVNALNEISAKRGMTENEYTNALNDIENTSRQDSYNLDTAFSNFVLGSGEKKVNQDVANKTAATSALYTILTNANVPIDQQAAFGNLLSKPGATADSVLRDLQMNLTPDQKKIISDARSSAAAASDNAIKLQIAQMNNETKMKMAADKLASVRSNIASRQASGQGNSKTLKDKIAYANLAEKYGNA